MRIKKICKFAKTTDCLKLLMLHKKRIRQLIALILGIEVFIYLWAFWTSTLNTGNFFSIEAEFIFDKCTRNSGRISAAIILIILFMVGFYGLKEIYSDDKKKDSFLILISLFTINHLIHFLFLFLRFKSHTEALTIE